jgi:hypothetical protein
MEFDKLKVFNRKLNIARDIDTYQTYIEHLNISKYFNVNIEDYLFKKYEIYILKKNKFPYNIKNTKHYILWINPEYEYYFNKNNIEKLINEFFINQIYIYWENCDSLKSIKSIKHYHIISKLNNII